jgi:hypothetical protein
MTDKENPQTPKQYQAFQNLLRKVVKQEPKKPSAPAASGNR